MAMKGIQERLAARGIEIEDPTSPIKPEHYLIVGNLRYVLPYFFDFKLNVKQRMAGQTLIDLFVDEFPARPRAYYEQAAADGRLRAIGALGPAGDLKPGQLCRHFLHRHEPPVPAAPLAVLAVTPDLVAVNKPAGMPVHVSGQYRKNTVHGLLEAERPDLGPLAPVHRLDKPVSGVLLFSRSRAAANGIRARIEACDLRKVYIARVQGAFPHEEITVDAPLAWDGRTGRGAVAAGSAGGPSDGAKPSVTHFKLLGVHEASGTSLVECRPQTGRTHQIRLHLAHLGHPIANDFWYGASRDAAVPAEARQHTAPVGAAPSGVVDGHAGAAGAAEAVSQHDDSDVRAVEPQRKRQRAGDEGPSSAGSEAPGVELGACAAGGPRNDELHPPPAAAPAASDGESLGPGATGRAAAPAAAAAGSVGRRWREGGRAPAGELEAEGRAALVPEELRDELCEHCPSLMPRNYPLDLAPLWLHARLYGCEEWSFEAPLPEWAVLEPYNGE